MLNRLFVTAMVLFVFFTASATDLLVPQQYATIQAAINAAVTGDSVLIAPGNYNEALTITGKAITGSPQFQLTLDDGEVSCIATRRRA
jgi:pectin methylesterase-like acyl-CoA thioesterase